jgi:zinc D-Ala-D-Ala carboxypeptidase
VLSRARVKRLNKVGGANNASNLGNRSPDDIPIAVRESVEIPAKTKVSKGVLVGIVAGLGAGGLAIGALVAFQLQRSQLNISDAATISQTVTPSPNASARPANADTMLNHYRYPEAPQVELVPLTSDASQKMRKAAAKAYQEMEAAAQRDGVSLVVLSAFRSVEDQKYLFFGKKAERGQVAAERAKVSAPPGYSEHHSGYALDMGDGNVPATNLSTTFENTPAYKWLKANAAFYSFENSFPKGNKQGVSYEPWHWRFVGDQESLEMFYKARESAKQPAASLRSEN